MEVVPPENSLRLASITAVINDVEEHKMEDYAAAFDKAAVPQTLVVGTVSAEEVAAAERELEAARRREAEVRCKSCFRLQLLPPTATKCY